MTDSELIDYTLKFDTDPVRIRLAKIMDNMPGIILDELENAGMDPERCTFENTYSPGQYITHLESEIDYLNRELQEVQEKLAEREAMTVSELIAELRQTADNAYHKVAVANRQLDEAQQERDAMHKKLKMWTTLNAQPKELQ